MGSGERSIFWNASPVFFVCLFVQFLLEPRIYSNTVGLLELEFLKSPTNGEVGGGTLREDVFSKK